MKHKQKVLFLIKVKFNFQHIFFLLTSISKISNPTLKLKKLIFLSTLYTKSDFIFMLEMFSFFYGDKLHNEIFFLLGFKRVNIKLWSQSQVCLTYFVSWTILCVRRYKKLYHSLEILCSFLRLLSNNSHTPQLFLYFFFLYIFFFYKVSCLFYIFWRFQC